MFKDSPEGQTHYEGDGCGEKAHNPMNQSISEEFGEKFKSPKWAPEKMQDVFNELMFGKDGVLDFWESKISQAIAEDRKWLREKIPKKMTMEAALESHSDVGAGYTIGYNACRDEVLALIKET